MPFKASKHKSEPSRDRRRRLFTVFAAATTVGGLITDVVLLENTLLSGVLLEGEPAGGDYIKLEG